MSNKVMVAVDGSEKDGRGLSIGLAMANLLDAAVHLVRVVDAASSHDAERALATTVDRLTPKAGRDISAEVLAGTDVSSVLVRRASERDVRVVVMGTRAASAAGLALVGSVADRVLGECPKPVVLVPPGAADIAGRDVELKRFLVPVDGSPLAARAVDFLSRMPRLADVQFVILQVLHNARDVAAQQRRLRRVADRFAAHDAHAESRVVVAGDVAQTIATAVRTFFVDMIAMSTRGESALKQLVFGSVAKGVVRAADVPVLLLTPTMLAADTSTAREHSGATR